MRWFQSFPYPAPPERSHVAWKSDVVERIAVEDGAYGLAIQKMAQRALAEGQPGLFMLEWDIAIGLDGMAKMEAAAKWKPELIHVVSYALHWTSRPVEQLVQWNAPIDVHEVRDMAPVTHSTKSILNCDYPGLGLIWFPAWVLELMEAENRWQALRYPNADAVFWGWVGKSKMNVVQDVNVVHLHW